MAEDPAAAGALLARALTEELGCLHLVRSDSRVKIYVAVATLGRLLARLVSPEDASPGAAVRVTLYITRPRSLELPPRHFHVLVLFGGAVARACVAGVRTRALVPGSTRVRAVFRDAVAVPAPADLPDPSAEVVPPAPAEHVDPFAFTAFARPPRDAADCFQLAPGVWWSYADRRLYLVQMDEALLALCPAGWRSRSLGGVLGRLLSHPEGCAACTAKWHIDALNAAPEPGACDVCPCAAPCLWKKARRQDVPVAGDSSLFRVLFTDAVARVRILGSRRRPRITGALPELLAGVGPRGEAVPVNGAGWQLRVMDDDVTRLLASSCRAMRSVCGSARLAVGLSAY
ncbi:tegument protein UL16 [bovine alphaherpesvirus 1]|uniref:Tegument protein UL16 n=1 Tax=Bovine herpesvirus 1 TaxID=10320 RepID=A0A0U2T294_BHV1|nr:virion protein [Bovine herpesvirus type 1.1]ALR87811.1 tegument protein UL16 [Bovine alphaherpesvirus 1]AFV53404.1 virion protein [Bovine herpesvirus type 1.1]AVM39191.1 cytoplasmic envelopment protein 2 [Bovine alphaherpesvirus 1]AVM39342.1 cytoplasmic envelopment protein 2 [Bovine alphaherpesvirus 1]AVM39415.1 cytoplasmic envelopment protein 2 [Bovine alphaherpesvirus 1]